MALKFDESTVSVIFRTIMFFISFFLIFSCSLLLSRLPMVYSGGCSAPPLLPDKPFVVIWNHPTSLCEDHGIHLDFDHWKIVDNTKDRFFGEKIVLLYSPSTFGKWPYLTSKNRPINGGIPQLSDLQAHLTKVENDLKVNVWNKSFDGLGIIDFEKWRPLYMTNFDSKAVYQRQSQALVRKRFPKFNQSQVLTEAILEFNKAARNFMEKTLTYSLNNRPAGKWGYYLFPRCYDATCNTTTIRNNDRISWLFEKSTALYPSIYFKLSQTQSARNLKIKLTLQEAFRVKAKFSSQDIPILPYSKSQEGPYRMYKNLELSNAVLQPANMGASGVVLWGSSFDARSKNECRVLQEYIDKTLGPYSLNVYNFFSNCTQQLCQGHGRCVRKDYEKVYQRHLRESGRNECLLPREYTDNSKSQQNVIKGTIKKKTNKQQKELFKKHPYERQTLQTNKALSFMDHFKNSLVYHFSVIEQDNSPKSFSVQSNNNINLESFQDSSRKSNSKFIFNPNYDFDDYVCKCYSGYSGRHCEQSLV